MSTEKDPVALVSQINATMEQMKKDHTAVMAELKTSAETAGTDAKAAIAKADELATKIAAASTSIVEMEQKLADKVRADKAPVETLGQMVIKSEAFKQYAKGNLSKMRIEANTITGQSGSPAANSDVLVPAQRLAGIIPGAFRSLRLRDLIPQGTTTSNAVEYTKELLFTNNAAETAEGAQKPESVLTFELASAPVATIAHFLKVSKQVLEDATALQSYIDTRLRYGVELRYDNQILNGNGSGQNISGVLDSGNYTAFTPETGDNQLDSINRAIEQVITADYAPTGIILSPADWHAIERLKVGTSDDRYIVGDPTGVMGPMLWGLPVVVTNNLASGKLVVAAFDIAYQVWNRSGTVVEIFEQDDTNVQKNLLTVRAEARGTLATYRAASSVYGNLLQA
jgi:HK97 family phage major capsid protein